MTTEEDGDGNPVIGTHWDGPYCPLCKDTTGKAVRLKEVGQMQRGNIVWECQVDNTDYEAPRMGSRS